MNPFKTCSFVTALTLESLKPAQRVNSKWSRNTSGQKICKACGHRKFRKHKQGRCSKAHSKENTIATADTKEECGQHLKSETESFPDINNNTESVSEEHHPDTQFLDDDFFEKFTDEDQARLNDEVRIHQTYSNCAS